MRHLLYIASCLTCATAAMAETPRSADAHEHGVGALNIALDGDHLAMELHAPGADIVGFEHPATSEADKAAVASALKVLAQPTQLFVLPEAAGCVVETVHVALEGEEAYEDHDHGDHEEHHDTHDHDEHAHDAQAHDDHGHEGHDHKGHDESGHEHDDDGHDESGHDEDGHDDHGHEEAHHDEAQHSEFHAEYLFHCSTPSALSEIAFPYFDLFPNALELELQTLSNTGANAFEVERDTPVLDVSTTF